MQLCAASGYWAFGWDVQPFVVSSFTFPTGLIAAVYVLAIIQIVGCYQIYARPTFGEARPCVALITCVQGPWCVRPVKRVLGSLEFP